MSPLRLLRADSRASSLAALVLAACGPAKDVVFEPASLELSGNPVSFPEGAGAVTVPVRLSAPAPRAITAKYEVKELEAQDTCQSPDFLSAAGSLSWAQGSTEAEVELWIGDDDLAELDERFVISVSNIDGAPAETSLELPVTIEDDDRTAIVDARAEFGLEPGKPDDQSAELQAALDQAAKIRRGVVLVAPGDYWIRAVSLSPGTTLSGRGATFHRPDAGGADTVSLSLRYGGATDSAATQVEGVTLDARRDAQQLDYVGGEGKDAHLVRVAGDAAQPGRAKITLDNLGLQAASGSGVYLDAQVDATLCRLRGEDLYRDLVTLRGGNSKLDGRELEASASVGTTGLWISGDPEGFGNVRTVDVQLSDVRLASGDLEIEGYGGSIIDIQRLSMTQAPFRLLAPNATITIADSVLQTGIPSSVHNYWNFPHDVTVTNTTLVVTETDDNGAEAPEADRILPAAGVRWDTPADDYPPTRAADAPHELRFVDCTFEAGADVDSSDQVFAVESDSDTGSVLLTQPTLGPGVKAALGPICKGCSVDP